jgi:carboxyl-terminal processing protease
MKRIIIVLFSAALLQQVKSQSFTGAQFREDFNSFWETIDRNYCYFNPKVTNWARVKEMYTAAMDTVHSRTEFTGIIEKALYEIYDHHAGLNTNTPYSRRLVPTNADMWAEYVNGKPLITEVRPGYGPATAGVKEGMEVIAVNDVSVEKAIVPFLPQSSGFADDEARGYALRVLLAGDHVQARKLTLKTGGREVVFFPDRDQFQLEHIQYASLLETKMIGSTGYIRINNCLYDNDLIAAFDSVMQRMQHTQSLILDLRETPSGGNTTVARAILGWFTLKDCFYQKHEDYSEEKQFGVKRSWMEIVSPRKGKYYGKPLVILANHWTGSIAEAIVVGFDGLRRKNISIIGTKLARLKGAVYTFEMPNTKIRYNIPVERLYTSRNVKREDYLPGIYIDREKESKAWNEDIFIVKALGVLGSRQ